MPHLFVRNVNLIRYSMLRHKLDIQFLVFDKDNTLTYTGNSDLHPVVETTFFRDLFENYYGRCFLLSNNDNAYLCEPPFEDLRREFGLPDFDKENGMVLGMDRNIDRYWGGRRNIQRSGVLMENSIKEDISIYIWSIGMVYRKLLSQILDKIGFDNFQKSARL